MNVALIFPGFPEYCYLLQNYTKMIAVLQVILNKKT